jgi:hypothetical protein
MNLELVEKLNKAREAIGEIDRILARNKYSDDLRTVMVSGLLATIIQHLRSLLVLINSGAVRSAAVLVRDTVYDMYVALWIDECASLDQADRFPLNYDEIRAQLDTTLQGNYFFENLKYEFHSRFYQYNRSGIIELGLWSLHPETVLHSDEPTLNYLIATATLCVVFLTAEFLAKRNHLADSQLVLALAESHLKRSA